MKKNTKNKFQPICPLEGKLYGALYVNHHDIWHYMQVCRERMDEKYYRIMCLAVMLYLVWRVKMESYNPIIRRTLQDLFLMVDVEFNERRLSAYKMFGYKAIKNNETEL